MTEQASSPLRRRMIEDISIRKFATKAQEIEGLRFAEPALVASVRRLASELDQASLLRR